MLFCREQKINEHCRVCGFNTNKLVSKHVLDTTELIIININRNNDPKNLVEFKYPEIIEKKDIINTNKVSINDKLNFKYEIFCVLKQYKIDNNLNLILFCKSFTNNTWYSYNNKKIREAKLEEATSDYENTCLIIYQLKNNKN